VKSNVVHAKDANQGNPEGNPKTVVDGALGVAVELLRDVEADPAESAARERDRALVESGRADEARANYAKAVDQARKDADELIKARSEAELAKIERDRAVAQLKTTTEELERRLKANQLANQKAIDDALDKERRKQQRKLTWVLSLGTIALLALGAFLAYTKFNAGEPIKALIAAGFWGGAAAICGVFAWAINQQWFQNLIMWLMIGTGVLGLAAGAIYVISELRSAREKKTLKVEAHEAEDTLKRIITTIDKLPDESADVLRTRLSKTMDGTNKALIHELRAEDQRAA
jgi:hypothetical protein